MGLVTAERDRCLLAVDAAFDEVVDRLDEIVAVELGVEAQDRASEEAVTISSFHGQIPKVSEFGQGMCQKVMMVASGNCSRTIFGNNAK